MLFLALWGCPQAEVGPISSTHPTVLATGDTASRTFAVLEGPTTGVPPDSEALLVGELRVTTDQPTHAVLIIEGPCGPTRVDFPGEATEHVLPIFGLHAASSHTIAVELDTGGEPIRYEAGAVDTLVIEGLPPVEVLAHDPANMEPGLLVFMPAQDLGIGWVLAVDEQLHVVYALRRTVSDLRLFDGAWVALNKDRIVRWDMYGREQQSWQPEDESAVHHEAFPLPDGGMLTLGYELVAEPNFPTDATLTATAPASLIGQVVLRFDAFGKVVEQHSLAAVLDTQRVGYLSFGITVQPYDWTHANSVVPWGDDAYLVNVRHLDVVLCLERSGELRWMLGDPTAWQEPWQSLFLAPVGDVVWPRQAHSLEVNAGGVVGMFDNGNYGGSPYAPAPDGYVEFSRGVGFVVDEDAMTVSTAWSIGHEGLFSHAMGDADLLSETGNLLLTFARVPSPLLHPRIVQVHPDRPNSPALDMRVGLDVRRWTYRADVVSSLYGPDVVETRGAEQ